MAAETDEAVHTNGHVANVDDAEHDGPKLQRSWFRALVQDFSPLWFTWCMNSGALSGLIHQCPYRFNGIDIIANIFFLANLVSYAIFSGIFILRLALYRGAAYREIVSSMAELTFASCWPIAFMTLTSGVSLIVSNAWWGGYAFSIVAYVMFWFVQAWNATFLFWAFIVLIRNHEASDRRIPFSIIIPAVSVATVAITGANVATFSKELSAKLAVPMMIVSFNWAGVGILLGLILYVYLFHGLLVTGWPPADTVPTIFILVGPMGQSAAALQVLGAAATTYGRFGDYNTGTFLTAESAKSMDAACVLIALLFNGLGVLWCILGIYCMLEHALGGKLHWTPSWNAIIFPNGTLTTSFLLFAIEMDSPAYRVIATMMTLILVAVYLFNLYMTVLRISQGKLLIVREDWRVKKEIEDRQKEK